MRKFLSTRVINGPAISLVPLRHKTVTYSRLHESPATCTGGNDAEMLQSSTQGTAVRNGERKAYRQATDCEGKLQKVRVYGNTSGG